MEVKSPFFEIWVWGREENPVFEGLGGEKSPFFNL